MTEEINQAQQAISQGWHNWIPFAALLSAAPAPKNRPLATRISEQILVAVIAGGGSAYTVNDSIQARHDEQIKALSVNISMQNNVLQKQIDESERRMVDQIKELRQQQYTSLRERK